MTDHDQTALAAATAEDFVEACLGEEGKAYVYGTEVEPHSESDAWDCSELVEVKLRELGIKAPDGSQAQWRWCEEHGEEISLEEAIEIPGALLFRVAESGHVAVSLGNGNTIEALGKQYGVGIFSATKNRTFNRAALVPGLDYGYGDEEVYEPAPPEEAKVEPPALADGSEGKEVKRLQRTLKQLGIDPGKIDGLFGEKTERAVRKLQKKLGVTIDGIVGKDTRKSIWDMVEPVIETGSGMIRDWLDRDSDDTSDGESGGRGRRSKDGSGRNGARSKGGQRRTSKRGATKRGTRKATKRGTRKTTKRGTTRRSTLKTSKRHTPKRSTRKVTKRSTSKRGKRVCTTGSRPKRSRR